MLKYFYIALCLLIFNINQGNLIAGDIYKLNTGTEAAILGSGAAIAIPAFILNLNTDRLPESDILTLNKDNLNFIDKFATNFYSPKISDISDVLLWTSFISPAVLLASSDVRSEWFETGTMYAETMIFAYALPHIAKVLIHRNRPFCYDDKAPISEKTEADAARSFFSGHTTVAFASAVFLSKVYSDFYPDSKYKPFIWTGSLLLAATVGTLRIISGKHFTTDVLTGAVVGSALGWLIPELHRNKEGANSTSLGIGLLGINLSVRF